MTFHTSHRSSALSSSVVGHIYSTAGKWISTRLAGEHFPSSNIKLLCSFYFELSMQLTTLFLCLPLFSYTCCNYFICFHCRCSNCENVRVHISGKIRILNLLEFSLFICTRVYVLYCNIVLPKSSMPLSSTVPEVEQRNAYWTGLA